MNHAIKSYETGLLEITIPEDIDVEKVLIKHGTDEPGIYYYPGGMDKGWKVINPDDETVFPPVGKDGYSNSVLLSFSNSTIRAIGRYYKDDDGGMFIYDGDLSFTELGLFVNAWCELPKSYRD